MSDSLRIGLVGCGRIAQLVHLGALAAADGLRVTALADPDAQRLHEAAQKAPGAVPYASAADLMRKSDAEAVVVCAPPALHAPLAIAAFEAGKHVYVEKPLALDLDETRAIQRAQQSAGTVGAVGFNYRFHPLHRDAKQRIHAGAVGEVVAVRTSFSSPARTLPDWKVTRAGGGGALLDLASHHIDLARFLFDDEITEVTASVASHHSEGDTAALQMTIERGLVVQSFVSMSSVAEDRVEVYGRDGKLSYDRQTSVEIDHRGLGVAYGRGGQIRRELGSALRSARRLPKVPHDPSFRLAFEAFARAARNGEPWEAASGATLDDGLQSLAVVLAAERSATSGRAERVEPDALAVTP